MQTPVECHLDGCNLWKNALSLNAVVVRSRQHFSYKYILLNRFSTFRSSPYPLWSSSYPPSFGFLISGSSPIIARRFPSILLNHIPSSSHSSRIEFQPIPSFRLSKRHCEINILHTQTQAQTDMGTYTDTHSRTNFWMTMLEMKSFQSTSA